MHAAQHTAPRLAEEVVVVLNAKVGEQVVEFGEEEVDGPEFGVEASVAHVRGVAVAELVVEDYWDAMCGG